MNSVEVQGISMADVIIMQSIARLLMAQEKQDAWHLPQVILLQEKAKVYVLHTCQNIPANIPADIWLFKVNNRNTRKRCKICSKLTTETPEHISHPFPNVSIFGFNQVFLYWDTSSTKWNARFNLFTLLSEHYQCKNLVHRIEYLFIKVKIFSFKSTSPPVLLSERYLTKYLWNMTVICLWFGWKVATSLLA